MKREFPVRTSQLTLNYGVGAMINQKGLSMIVGGLDSWFPTDAEQSIVSGNAGSGNQFFDETEFIFHESRLEARLRVGSFRMPPDFREPQRGNKICCSQYQPDCARVAVSAMACLPAVWTDGVFAAHAGRQSFLQKMFDTRLSPGIGSGHIDRYLRARTSQ